MGAFGAHALKEQLKRRDTTQVRHALAAAARAAAVYVSPPCGCCLRFPHLRLLFTFPPLTVPVLVHRHAVPNFAQRGSAVAACGFQASRCVVAVRLGRQAVDVRHPPLQRLHLRIEPGRPETARPRHASGRAPAHGRLGRVWGGCRQLCLTRNTNFTCSRV